MKILVVDDDLDLLELTSRKLSRKGFEVMIASNLADASQFLAQSPDMEVVISDLKLSHGESGLTLYEQHLISSETILFILATGDSESEPLIQKYKTEQKNFACLEKPYTFDSLLKTISRN